MPHSICSFFAILKDESIKKIDLMQNITDNIENVFISNGLKLLNEETQEILFNGDYVAREEEVFFVELQLPENVVEVCCNPIGFSTLDLTVDEVKTIFWVKEHIYYFQNFDNRKLLKNKNVIFYDRNSYNKLTENALIIDNSVNAIYKNGKFYFKSYSNANKIFSLLDYFREASNEDIDEFVNSDKLLADVNWLKTNANSSLRKQITLIQKSGILEGANVRKIKSSAKKFNLAIELSNGKLKLPNDKKQCRDILCFLNEQYYIGLISGNKYQTNSKKNAE